MLKTLVYIQQTYNTHQPSSSSPYLPSGRTPDQQNGKLNILNYELTKAKNVWENVKSIYKC